MLVSVSATHRNASFELLERLSTSTDELAGDVVASHQGIRGAVVLATCNRFEAYLETEDTAPENVVEAVDAMIARAADMSGVDQDELRHSIRVRAGLPVAEHLFSVSAGLDSVVVGEGEIAGQVRRALATAREHGTTSSELERLFQRASQTSRGVKNRTEIGRAGRSLVRLALDLAESRVTEWAQARIVLVGTGSYARVTLATLRDRGANDIAVYSPSGRGRRFVADRHLELIEDGHLAEALARADVIITCTATERVLGPELFTPSTDTRRLVIDLGLPRNVDPAVGLVPGIELLDLETVRLHAPLEELSAHDDARSLVERATRKFAEVEAEQTLAPAVVAMRKHVFDALDAEIERARKRGDSSEQTEQALRHLAGVLLHTPSVRARELAAAGEAQRFIDGLEALFGIAPAAPATALPAPTSVADVGTASA